MWQAHGMKIYFMFRTFNLNKISQALNCEDTVGQLGQLYLIPCPKTSVGKCVFLCLGRVAPCDFP